MTKVPEKLFHSPSNLMKFEGQDSAFLLSVFFYFTKQKTRVRVKNSTFLNGAVSRNNDVDRADRVDSWRRAKKNLAILIDKVVIAFVEGKFLELFSWNERNRIDAI